MIKRERHQPLNGSDGLSVRLAGTTPSRPQHWTAWVHRDNGPRVGGQRGGNLAGATAEVEHAGPASVRVPVVETEPLAGVCEHAVVVPRTVRGVVWRRRGETILGHPLPPVPR